MRPLYWSARAAALHRPVCTEPQDARFGRRAGEPFGVGALAGVLPMDQPALGPSGGRGLGSGPTGCIVCYAPVALAGRYASCVALGPHLWSRLSADLTSPSGCCCGRAGVGACVVAARRAALPRERRIDVMRKVTSACDYFFISAHTDERYLWSYRHAHMGVHVRIDMLTYIYVSPVVCVFSLHACLRFLI